MLREAVLPGDGTFREWVTSKCGEHVIPDALQLTCDSINSKVLLCRTMGGNYTGGLNHDGRSYQFLVEQSDPVSTPHAPTHLIPIRQESADVRGGVKFKCTILAWDNDDCNGSVTDFASSVVDAKCDPFSLSGSWKLPDITVDFSIQAADNNYGLLEVESQTSDITLVVDGMSPSQHKTVSRELEKGNYIVDIVDCCLGVGGQYTGHIEIEYRILNGTYVKRFPSLGTSHNVGSVRAAYKGLAIDIEHAGGPVSARLVTPAYGEADGQVVVRFTPANDRMSAPRTQVPKAAVSDGCQIHAGFIRWYDEGWRTGSCIGASVSVLGQDYIIVRRSSNVGSHPCSDKYDNPAIAWPTLDSETFVKVPQSGSVIFKRDKSLESAALDELRGRRYHKSVGDPSTIDIILFPTTQQ